MKRVFYLFSFFIVLLGTAQLNFAQTINVTKDFSTDPEWTGSGNTGNTAPNFTDFGYRNIEGVTGVKEGDFGCIGGVFSRTGAYSYYADTELNGNVNRTMILKVAGCLKLENRTSTSFDGGIGIGYFDATNPSWNSFLGIQIKEPMTPADAFRGVAGFNITNESTSKSANIPLTQLVKLDFDITYTGSADGSGLITGKLAGQDINVTVPAGTTEFNTFGLITGGFSITSERTRNCYFDDLTYSKLGSSAVDNKLANMIQIYPNVTSDMIFISNMPENSRIEVLDLVGKKVAVKSANEVKSGYSLASFTGGMYLIQVIEGNNTVKSVKIFKR
jgi:hypothetical protein